MTMRKFLSKFSIVPEIESDTLPESEENWRKDTPDKRLLSVRVGNLRSVSMSMIVDESVSNPNKLMRQDSMDTTERVVSGRSRKDTTEDFRTRYEDSLALITVLEAAIVTLKSDHVLSLRKAKNESDLILHEWIGKYNAIVAVSNASETLHCKQAQASKLASRVADLKSRSILAIERDASDSKFLNQKSRYETAATAAADASLLATEEAKVEANSRMAIERDASKQAAINATESAEIELNVRVALERYSSRIAAFDASKASDNKFLDQKSLYETAATAAADASQLAADQAKVEANSRMAIERDASKQAALDASEASDNKFLDQKSRYETAATAAADAALMEAGLLRNISANYAHDLKSPLHTLLIGLEYFRGSVDGKNTPPQNKEMLDALDSACAFMGSAISRTIDFSKTSGGLSLTPSNISFKLEASLNNPIKWMKAMLVDGRKTVCLDPLPPGVNTLITDKHWVEENLLCLLSNAVKYSSEGCVRVAVTVKEKFVRITVEDNGIGISKEAKLQLFKMYSTVQTSAVGSTGLGLYSLLMRTEAIGGKCGVDDRSDGKVGSAFWFTFPYRPDNIAIEKEIVRERPRGSSFRPLKILIVDDSVPVVKILDNKLTAIGHDVLTSFNGADGLKIMLEMKNQLDLVIMDIQMPVMDGIEATKRFREIEREDTNTPRLPIICSSANSGGELESLALLAGVDSFLPKPFTTAVLSAAIEGIYTLGTLEGKKRY